MSMLQKVFSDYKRIKKEAAENLIAEKKCARNGTGFFGEEPIVHDLKWHIDNRIKAAAEEIENVCDLLEDERYGNAMLRLASIVKNGQDAVKSNTENRQWYMITIRPDCSKCHFLEFKNKIDLLLERRCFIEGSYSFEQKAVEQSKIGDGFHVHIVAKMKQTSKGQVLRDMTSSFKDWIENGYITPNNIDVRGTKNPDDLIDNYLLEYKSEDGHKETTRAMDEMWRTSIGLKRIYTLTH